MIKISDYREIYEEPINKVIGEINFEKNSSTFLMGLPGSGKTTVIDKIKIDKNTPFLVDGTLENSDICNIDTEYVFDLYYISLIIKKMLLSIMQNYPQEFLRYFSFFNTLINDIIATCRLIAQTEAYQNLQKVEFQIYLCYKKEYLLDEFFKLLNQAFDDKNIILILDNFDKAMPHGERFQKLMYRMLRERLKLILSISDGMAILDKEHLTSLGDTVMVDYARDIENVKIIINRYLYNRKFKKMDKIANYGVQRILRDSDIETLLLETNYNIWRIMGAINYLYNSSITLDQERNGIILKRILEEKVMPPRVLRNYEESKRKLYL